ncbi:hypothetical protein [Amycolatopsis plumensis]|uniref:Uncharacterized protein n=1 Tax=Amycolatopsis plumensis TaxID=236508 RepID=A0ABV5UBI0_9PSEU
MATLTCWRHRRGTAVGTGPDSGVRATLADLVVTPPRPCLAEGYASLAATFARLPGLAVAAVPVGHGACLLGDRSGGTARVDGVPAELAAVAVHLWLASGRRLDALGPVRADGRPGGPAEPSCEDPAGCHGDLVVVAGQQLLRLAFARPQAAENLLWRR